MPHDPTEIRNVALVGHHGAGKTTLAEALLAATGAIPRQGSVDRGTAVCDSEPEETSRHLSVSLAIAAVLARDAKNPEAIRILGDLNMPPPERLRAAVLTFFRSECDEAAFRSALEEAAPLYREAPEASAHAEEARQE